MRAAPTHWAATQGALLFDVTLVVWRQSSVL
jgi:hypothetical protein